MCPPVGLARGRIDVCVRARDATVGRTREENTEIQISRSSAGMFFTLHLDRMTSISQNSTNRIFRSVKKKEFFGYVRHNCGIRGADHHKRATLTQPSPTSFPVSGSVHCMTNAAANCLVSYTALWFQQPFPTSLAPCLTCSLSSQRGKTLLHTACKFREFPRYFVHPTMCFACRMR